MDSPLWMIHSMQIRRKLVFGHHTREKLFWRILAKVYVFNSCGKLVFVYRLGIETFNWNLAGLQNQFIIIILNHHVEIMMNVKYHSSCEIFEMLLLNMINAVVGKEKFSKRLTIVFTFDYGIIEIDTIWLSCILSYYCIWKIFIGTVRSK